MVYCGNAEMALMHTDSDKISQEMLKWRFF